MIPLRRMLVLVLVTACLLAMVPSQARADGSHDKGEETDCVQVVIKNAEYCDLDGDGSQDDIETAFRIKVLSDEVVFKKTEIYCFLTLPSGRAFVVGIAFKGAYLQLALVIGWLNVVTESGWYTFSTFCFLIGDSAIYCAYSSVAFDPPTGGDPGPPLAEILSIEVKY